MTTDMLRLDVPAGADEFMLLKSMKIGDIRRSQLMPALMLDVEWKCTEIWPYWTFEGRFCGMLVATIDISQNETSLLMVMREPPVEPAEVIVDV